MKAIPRLAVVRIYLSSIFTCLLGGLAFFAIVDSIRGDMHARLFLVGLSLIAGVVLGRWLVEGARDATGSLASSVDQLVQDRDRVREQRRAHGGK